MDGQMPEMDGLAAIRAIRSAEATENRPHLPVIALTAHTLAEDRERFLSAGFDGYVRKPISLNELLDTIDRVVPPVSAAFDETAALTHVLGDAKLLREIAQLFLNEAPAWLAAIRDAVGQADARRLAASAHIFKGAADHLGAASASACVCELEELGRSGNLDQAPELLERLEAIVSTLESELGRFVRGDTMSGGGLAFEPGLPR